MKKTIFFLISLLVPLSVLCEDGVPADYKLNVSPFRQLTVVDGISVEYYCNPDSAGWIFFTAEPEKASQITFNNNKEHLTIQTTADERPLDNLPTVKVYSSSLMSVENSGDSILSVNLGTHVPEFKAKQIGNGHIEIKGVDTDSFDGIVAAGRGSMSVGGVAKKAKLRNVSTGLIDAERLEAAEINCFIFGPGNLICNPTKAIKIMGAGNGKVYYPVKPEKVSNRSIGVKSFEGKPE